LKLKGLIKMQ